MENLDEERTLDSNYYTKHNESHLDDSYALMFDGDIDETDPYMGTAGAENQYNGISDLDEFAAERLHTQEIEVPLARTVSKYDRKMLRKKL